MQRITLRAVNKTDQMLAECVYWGNHWNPGDLINHFKNLTHGMLKVHRLEMIVDVMEDRPIEDTLKEVLNRATEPVS